MPRKSDSIPINNEKLDRRVKLTSAQRQEIFENKNGMSQRELASKYAVSRRLITFILDPKKYEENKKRRKERGGSKAYYNREAHNKAIREHREYKHKLFKDGKI